MDAVQTCTQIAALTLLMARKGPSADRMGDDGCDGGEEARWGPFLLFIRSFMDPFVQFILCEVIGKWLSAVLVAFGLPSIARAPPAKAA